MHAINPAPGYRDPHNVTLAIGLSLTTSTPAALWLDNRTLTLPRNLSATLPFLNVGRFEAALQRTGLLADLDGRAKITVLAPVDSVFATNTSSLPEGQLAEALKRHVLVGVTAYTPLLRDGAVFRTLGGTNVTVSVRGGEVYLGEALVVSGDAILTNGVVHTIDTVR